MEFLSLHTRALIVDADRADDDDDDDNSNDDCDNGPARAVRWWWSSGSGTVAHKIARTPSPLHREFTNALFHRA